MSTFTSYASIAFGKTWTVSLNLLLLYLGWEGEIDFYIFGGGFSHGGLVFRKRGAPGDGDCAKVELTHLKREDSRYWRIVCRLSEWKPPNGQYTQGQYKWHVRSIMHRTNDVCQAFGDWKWLWNNCNNFIQGLKNKFTDTPPPTLNKFTKIEEVLKEAKDLYNVKVELVDDEVLKEELEKMKGGYYC